MTTSLYRSRHNKMIAGVAGGLGEYLNIDPTLIRIGWAALTLIGGTGFLLYIIASIIIPEEPETTVTPVDQKPVENTFTDQPGEPADAPEAKDELDSVSEVSSRIDTQSTIGSDNSPGSNTEKRRQMFGIFLVIFGLAFAIDEFVPRWIDSDLLWAVGLIAAGILLVKERQHR